MCGNISINLFIYIILTTLIDIHVFVNVSEDLLRFKLELSQINKWM